MVLLLKTGSREVWWGDSLRDSQCTSQVLKVPQKNENLFSLLEFSSSKHFITKQVHSQSPVEELVS